MTFFLRKFPGIIQKSDSGANVFVYLRELMPPVLMPLSFTSAMARGFHSGFSYGTPALALVNLFRFVFSLFFFIRVFKVKRDVLWCSLYAGA